MTTTAGLPTKWLDETFDYRFDDEQLFRSALTHRSGRGQNNERLEYLGDAILGFLIAEELYSHYVDATEGELTRRRALLVKRETLAELAAGIGLGDHLKLGSGELKSGGFRRDSILADALEALFAAIYLDGGLDRLRSIVLPLFRQRMVEAVTDDLKDPKTRLQEQLQANGMDLPDYEVVQITGKSHQQEFKVSCKVDAVGIDRIGSGSSRRRAEQDAANQVIDALEKATP